MEMSKLTAKLRDAVPVCLLVEGKEVKRYKNIEIPEELKKLEYQDFEFNVPTNGNITFKITFAPGVLPEDFPKVRECRTRVAKKVPVTVESKTPTNATEEEATEATQETKTIIAIQDDLVEGVPKAHVAGEGATNPVELQVGEEATLVVVAEPNAKDAKDAKKAATKSKKTPAKSSRK